MKGYFTKELYDAPHTYVCINIYDNSNVLLDYYFVPKTEIIGYCHCLEDFGYEDKGWVEAIEDEEID